ncbi:MAG: tetratricopeptide repeat protein [Candidatus Sulfopaludibacter sp.]|nr:tetratricopeptide repeat protein [Candidatus Sulfopaludibacter sp.]
MKAGTLKLVGLAAVLAVGTWVLSNTLLSVKPPADFPKLPNTRSMGPALRNLLVSADRDARKHAASADAVGKLAMAYHANEYFEQAAAAYRIAARLAPRDAQWVYCQALLREEQGNEKEQVEFLQQTVALQPAHVPALLKLADGFFKQDKLDEAARHYELAARASGKDSSLHAAFGLARVAARQGQWNKVVEYAAPLCKTYPLVRPPYRLLQTAYEALGQMDKAAAEREAILSGKFTDIPPIEDPAEDRLADLSYSSTRLLKVAGLLSRFGYPDRAVQVARRAAEANPTDPDIRDFIARTLLTAYPDKPDSIAEALTQLGECLRLKPDDPVPLWRFSNDFFAAPKPPAAVQRLSGMMRPYAGLGDAHFYLGLAADARGENQEALSQYQAALKNNPSDSNLYYKLGLILDKAGKLDGAVAYLQRSVELDPSNTIARFNLGVVLMQQSNYGRGLKELGEVLRIHPHDAATHFVIGFAYLYTRRTDEAIASFRHGLRYKQDDAEAHYGLGSALSIQHKREDAVAELREALRLQPNYPEAQQLLRQLDR